MSDVPSDIYREILLRLPAESLLRFRAVCRAWRSIIADTSFIKLHTLNQRSSSSSSLLIEDCVFNLLYFLSLKSLTYAHPAQPTVDLTYIENLVDCGVPRLLELPTITCHGLILHFLSDSTKDWVIWNPLTLDFHKLSVPEHKYSMELASTGLGYDYAADEYKVVRIDAMKSESELVLKTRVHSLKSRTWKVIKDCPSDTLKSCGVYLNGALHWISKTMLVSLDLATEEYSLLPLPPLPPLPAVSGKDATMYLDALDGCLFVSYYYIGGDCVDAWIMKDEISTEITWRKLLSLSGGYESKRVGGSMTVFRPMAYSKSRGEIVMRHC